jgi:hypothetical protein
MPATGVQKLALVCLPVAGFGLALATSEGDWNLPRKHYGSLRDAALAREAAKAAPPAPAPAPDAAAPAAPEKPAKEAAEAKPKEAPAAPAAGGKAPAPEAGTKPEKPAPAAPAKPVLPKSDEVDLPVSGVAVARSGLPLKHRAADRMDVAVVVGGLRVGTDFVDAGTAGQRISGAEDRLKKDGLLLVLPNARTGWDEVLEVLGAGVGSGWSRVGLAVAHPDHPGKARVLPVEIPAKAEADVAKGIDPVLVTVAPGPNPGFNVNGEDCHDAAELEKKVKSFHEEFELMEAGYAGSVDRTPWTVEGKGAMVAGVVAALDTLRSAGVPSVRIAGVARAAPAAAAPAEGKPDGEPKPPEEKPPEGKGGEEGPK